MEQQSIGIICTSPGFGGLEMNTLKFANYLQNAGWKVRLLLNGDSITHQRAKDYISDIQTIQNFGGTQRASASIIKKWLSSTPVQILLTPFNKDIAAISNYKRFKNRKVKLVYQQHMKVGVKKKDIIHTLRYNMLDLWISPLEYLKQETIDKTSVKENKIVVIPFGLESTKFLATDLTKDAARSQMNLPQDVFLIGVLGRIDPKKGQDFLIRALTELPENHHLIIAGDSTPGEGDAYLNRLHELVKKHALENRVHFIKSQKDVVQFYKALDVFAMLSHGETYGMVTLEAMLFGVPVIGVNTDGTAELLQHGKLGWLHELEDVKGFCEQLQVIKQSAKTKALLQFAKEEVLNNFSFEKAMRETDSVLSNLL